jgi:uncharacterized protein YciI
MRKFLFNLTVFVLFAVINANAQNAVTYDSVLAKKSGADEFGMKKYVLALLKKGTAGITDPAKVKELLSGHMANMGKLAAEGKLVLAGPMMDDTGLEGIFIFNVTTVEEAEVLGKTDPAVKAGLFSIEYHPWYASAALMEVVGIHKTLQKKKF